MDRGSGGLGRPPRMDLESCKKLTTINDAPAQTWKPDLLLGTASGRPLKGTGKPFKGPWKLFGRLFNPLQGSRNAFCERPRELGGADGRPASLSDGCWF